MKYTIVVIFTLLHSKKCVFSEMSVLYYTNVIIICNSIVSTVLINTNQGISQNRIICMLNRHEECRGGNKCNLDNTGKMTSYYCYSTYHQKCRKFLSCFLRIQTCFYDCISFFILFIPVIYSRGLSFILSVIYVILYSSANVPLNKPLYGNSLTKKIITLCQIITKLILKR